MTIVNLNKLNSNQTSQRRRKISLKLLIVVLILLAIILPSINIYLAVRQVFGASKQMSFGIKQQNLDIIKTGVDDTSLAMGRLNGSLNWLFWLRVIPFIGGYYSDIKHFSQAAVYELSAAKIIVDKLEPVKEEVELAGQPVPGQDKIAQALKILDKLTPNLDSIQPNLKKASDEVADIDTGKYPENFRGTLIKPRISLVKDFISGASFVVADNRQLIQLLPKALGQDESKSYLILFQNDKELRATGGFITAYAFLRLDKGHLSTTVSDDIYRLDERLLKVCLNKICPLTPPAPIVRYLPEENGKPRAAWSMRDSNISPDLPTSIKQFERMYELLGEGLPFDGVITIDTYVVEELIKLTGPVDIYGTTYSAETDKRCNCANVIYELEHYSEIAAKGESDRKAVLGTLMQQILGKALNLGPDRLPQMLDIGIKLANSKNIMFYMHDSAWQQALDNLSWTGVIKKFPGDYLHINESNFAGGKSNLYVEEKVSYEITTQPEGLVKNKLTIEYKNPQPFSSWLNGILRDYVRVYVPSGSKLVASKGSDDQVETLQDEMLDKTYFEAFVQVRPQNLRVLSFEYILPNKLSAKNYPLLIQKQPGSKDHHYIVKINGKTKEEFDLTADRKLQLAL